MNAITVFCPNDAWLTFAASVVIQVTAISGLALTAIKLAGSRRPALRHAFGLTALMVILLCPFIVWTARQTGIAVLPAVLPKITFRESAVAGAMALNNVPFDIKLPVGSDEQSSHKMASAPEMPATRAIPGHRSVPQSLILGIVTLTWLTGMGVLFMRLIYGMGYQQACCRRARPLDMNAYRNAIQNTAAVFGQSLPPIFVSRPADLPLAAGWFRPRVLLPEGLPERITSRQLESILLHECAHIVRGDQWMGLAQRLAEMIFWFHPFIHMLNQQIGRAREEVCDNYALQKGGVEDYARTLLQLAEYMPSYSHIPATAALIGPKWKLEERIKGILDKRRQIMTHINKLVTVFTAVAFIGIAILSSVKAENGEKAANVPTEAVKLEVRFAEISEADIAALGLKSLSTDNSNPGAVCLLSVLNKPELTTILEALQQKTGNNCLSAPIVITKNGSPAELKITKEVPYPSQTQSATSTNISFEKRDIGVILEATPTVKADKETISLLLKPKVVLAEWATESQGETKYPVFHSHEAIIPVAIKDGQTVVMGGVRPADKQDKNFLVLLTASRVDSSGDKKNDTTDNARVMTPMEYEEIQDTIKGKTSGIGVVITFDSETGLSSIIKVIPDSPADKAGIKTGDRIVSVNDKTYKGRQTNDVVAEIRGKAGEKVSLKILRGDSIITKEIVREKIVLNPVHAETLANKVGLVSIRHFDGMTSELLREALKKLKGDGITALVVDLRGNPGGLFDQAVKSVECLLPKGAIVVRMESSDGKEDVVTTTTEPIIQGIWAARMRAALFRPCFDTDKVRLTSIS